MKVQLFIWIPRTRNLDTNDAAKLAFSAEVQEYIEDATRKKSGVTFSVDEDGLSAGVMDEEQCKHVLKSSINYVIFTFIYNVTSAYIYRNNLCVFWNII